jgi:hypothetical protein
MSIISDFLKQDPHHENLALEDESVWVLRITIAILITAMVWTFFHTPIVYKDSDGNCVAVLTADNEMDPCSTIPSRYVTYTVSAGTTFEDLEKEYQRK